MSVIGKGTLSIKKKEVAEQKTVALGFKKVKFAHQASAGQTGFNLGTLVTPTDMSTLGFVQPSAATLLKGNLFTFRNNLKLVSSLRGLLIDQLSYVVSSSSQITFVGFTAAEGEIFVGHFDEAPATSLSVVDGRTVVASGILAAGQTDFNIGTPIVINQNPLANVGAVMVFVDRGLQYRKAGNAQAADGDYIEVPVAGGLGSLIRFNASAVDRYVMVMSNGVVAERPDGSMMAAIERVQGQVDAMVPVLASAAGVPTNTFQTGPSSVDLKQFGDTVSQLRTDLTTDEARITALENPQRLYIEAQGCINTGNNGTGDIIIQHANIQQVGTGANYSSGVVTFTRKMRIQIGAAGSLGGGGGGAFSGGSYHRIQLGYTPIGQALQGLRQGYVYPGTNQNDSNPALSTFTLLVNPGDTIHIFAGSNRAYNFINNNAMYFSVAEVGAN